MWGRSKPFELTRPSGPLQRTLEGDWLITPDGFIGDVRLGNASFDEVAKIAKAIAAHNEETRKSIERAAEKAPELWPQLIAAS